MRTWAVAVLLGAATPAVAADQFDLVCATRKGAVHYRVDLARSAYCAGDCSVMLTIASSTPGMIVLEDHQPTFRGDKEEHSRINRTTGEWHTFSFNPRFDTTPFVRDGKCEPAPFSGFPTAKF